MPEAPQPTQPNLDCRRYSVTSLVRAAGPSIAPTPEAIERAIDQTILAELANRKALVKGARRLTDALPQFFPVRMVDFLRASGRLTPDLETLAEAARRFKTIPRAKHQPSSP